MAEADKATLPFWAKCPECGHCWPAGYYPMNLARFAQLVIGAHCPKGCESRPVVADQNNGRLLEGEGGLAAVEFEED